MTDPVTTAAPAGDTPPIQTDPSNPQASTAAPASSTPPVATVLDPAAPAGAEPSAEGWGADWRQKYAGDDEKLLKRLERYASPKSAIDALLEAQTKISKGEFAKPLPADATDEQKAAWREANGIPAKPEDYFAKLPNGVVLGDEDKAIFASVAEKLHAHNAPPEIVHELVGWYNEFKDAEMTRLAEMEQSTLASTQDALREEWGGDYRANVNVINSLLASAPEGIKDSMLTARLPDGTPLLHQPAMMRWLAQQAREINPAATLVPNASNPTQGIEQEIASIEKTMRTDRKSYNNDEKMQARYRQLLEARDKLLARAS